MISAQVNLAEWESDLAGSRALERARNAALPVKPFVLFRCYGFVNEREVFEGPGVVGVKEW